MACNVLNILIKIVHFFIKTCRYRNVQPYPPYIFSHYADYGCYEFTRNDFFVGGHLMATACETIYNNEIYIVPGILVFSCNQKFNIIMRYIFFCKVNSMCMPFSHDSGIVQENVKRSFQNNAIYTRWLNCCRDALHCCHNHLYNDIFKGTFSWSVYNNMFFS